MKKTLLTIISALLLSLTANAQGGYVPPFGKGKIYMASSLTGLGLSYNANEKWNLGLDTKGGYMFMDNIMFTGTLGYDYRQRGNNSLLLGAGARYYIEQNGLYLGAGANYVHEHNFDDLRPTVQLGYAFFLNRYVTIEPELYYNQSLKNHADYSGFGLRIGLGIYFF